MYNVINEMYEDLGSDRELCACTYQIDFDNFVGAINYGDDIFDMFRNEKLIERKRNELHFHNFLKHQMFSHLQEIKYYSRVNIADTRRLVAVSSDCISTIQMLVRDKVYLNVYFRSSDIDGALPADLQFLTTLPSQLIEHLQRLRDVKGYEDVTDELLSKIRTSKVRLTLMFGSLHRTV